MSLIVKSIVGMMLIFSSLSSQAMNIWIVGNGQDVSSNSQGVLSLSEGMNTLDLYYDVAGDISYGYDFILDVAGSGTISNVIGGDSDLGDVFGSGWRQFGGSPYGEEGNSVLAFSFDFFAGAGSSLLISGSYTNIDFLDETIASSTIGTVAAVPVVVPVPAAVWLFGSGLIGLIGIARRKKS